MVFSPVPNLGIGVGLRPTHVEEIFATWPEVDWFEIISEHFLDPSTLLDDLDKILERYPVVMHGVSLAIGSPTPLDWDYLKKIKALIKKTKSPWTSDHLSWGKLPGAHFHDLLPLPRVSQVIDYVAERARIIQDYLEVPFALENLSSYASFVQDELSEWEFYEAIVRKAGIFMMLDVNNVYVSSRNQGFDPKQYLEHLPLEKVIQIHLAGHQDLGGYILDSHNRPVCDAVWDLYAEVYPKTNGVSTLLEWDADYPSFEVIWKEALKAKAFQKEVIGGSQKLP